MNPNNNTSLLFKKYFEHRLSTEELKQLRELINQTDDSQLNDILQDYWNKYTPSVYSVKRPEALARIKSQLREKLDNVPPKKSISFIYRYKIAAAILILVLLGISSLWYQDHQSIDKITAQQYTIHTEKGERASISLPDGTKVYLNTETTISYPASFGLNNRKVQLEGEACFDVTPNKKIPFIVSTAMTQIKVLGTQFNVYAYPNQNWIETALIKGKIELSFLKNKNKPIILKPNEVVRYNKVTGETQHKKTDLLQETAWRRGDIIFHSESLANIFKELESFYGVHIHIQGALPSNLFTGSFHEEDISWVLLNLQQLYKFTYEKKGNNVQIKINQ